MSNLYAGEGVVVAVCLSPEHCFPTYPQEQVFIDSLGIPGDAHSGSMRESFTKPGTFKPNDRPISLVADEVRLEMNERFDINLQPGDFSEQILVRGLGDLGYIAIGSQVTFSSGVKLEVVDRAWPCAKLTVHNGERGLVKALNVKVGRERYSRRGLLTSVLSTGYLKAGDTLTVSTT